MDKEILQSKTRIGGLFKLECLDKNGRVKWVDEVHNLITNEGLDHLLDVLLHADTQVDPWYLAIFEDNHTPVAGDTYAVPGYTECTAYDEATRPAYVEAAASSQSVTNSASPGTFTINATKSVYGAALVGGGSAPGTKGDAAGGGTLLCAVSFSSVKNVESGDTLNVTYTLSAADDGV